MNAVDEELRILHGYRDEYLAMKQQLVQPPAGWSVFGTHIDSPDVALEFWGNDGGMPIWERPAPPVDAAYVVTAHVNATDSFRIPEALGAMQAWLPDARIVAVKLDE